ncbi:MAG: hypothetical protein RIR95_2232 [Pseudomonadota bacterium]
MSNSNVGDSNMSGKILIIDDVATNRVVLRVKLSASGYIPLLASNGTDGLLLAQSAQPDLVLLDAVLPDMSLKQVLCALRANPKTAGIPVLVNSAASTSAMRIQAFREGADDVLSKPLDDQTLLTRIRNLLRDDADFRDINVRPEEAIALGFAEGPAAFQHVGQIALVVSTPESGLFLRRSVAAFTKNDISVLTQEEALSAAFKVGKTPDVYLIEADLGQPAAGLRLMSELMSRNNSRHAKFAIFTSEARARNVAVAFDLGADDLIFDTISGEELALRLSRLLTRKRRNDRHRITVQDGLRMAVTDPLTGMHNRRFGLAHLGVIAHDANITGQSFAVMVVDIDRFKAVNDNWGHAVGDFVLREVASRLSLNIRHGDLLARVGGEEFLVALPATSFALASGIANRLRNEVETHPIVIPGGQTLSVTVSIGLAFSPAHAEHDGAEASYQIMERADKALLTAKSSGRNQVTIARTAA